ncbi:sulfur carrier protein ThiS [uncultured Roseibium sp.]|uniref:sulfur carrier protein ThiS n=1 Tax=uncultured Roseibium sp. TaxID=1936171 RepID=UPI0026258DAF|nr:sulfur carrier protein ThiS [uncultured Roseibium sp.]
MKLIVNGEAQEAECKTLAGLLKALNYDGDWLATAVNGELVQHEERAIQTLVEGDQVEILSPMQGG